MIYKGCIYHLVRVRDIDSETPKKLESGPLVKELSEVFLDNLPGVPPKREIDFVIYPLQDTQFISIHPYRMVVAEPYQSKENWKICWIRVSSDQVSLHGVL